MRKGDTVFVRATVVRERQESLQGVPADVRVAIAGSTFSVCVDASEVFASRPSEAELHYRDVVGAPVRREDAAPMLRGGSAAPRHEVSVGCADAPDGIAVGDLVEWEDAGGLQLRGRADVRRGRGRFVNFGTYSQWCADARLARVPLSGRLNADVTLIGRHGETAKGFITREYPDGEVEIVGPGGLWYRRADDLTISGGGIAAAAVE